VVGWPQRPAIGVPAGELQVWRADVAALANSLPGWERYLPPTERERAAHYLRPGDRALPPSPGFPALRFNLAHSGDLVLLAVADSSEVGVDIEQIRPVTGMAAIARRALMPAECDQLFSRPPAEHLALFFRYWSRKEALLKAHGATLASALWWEPVPAWHSVRAWHSVPPAPEGWQRVRCMLDGHATGEWSLFDLDPGPGYTGAVAVAASSTTWRLQRRAWSGIGTGIA
jgi:4'-phosphopantetheinyl transferase